MEERSFCLQLAISLKQMPQLMENLAKVITSIIGGYNLIYKSVPFTTMYLFLNYLQGMLKQLK